MLLGPLPGRADDRLRVGGRRRDAPPARVLDLPDGGGNLLLVGRRALVLSHGRFGPSTKGAGVMSAPDAQAATLERPTTTITVVDLADPAKPGPR